MVAAVAVEAAEGVVDGEHRDEPCVNEQLQGVVDRCERERTELVAQCLVNDLGCWVLTTLTYILKDCQALYRRAYACIDEFLF